MASSSARLVWAAPPSGTSSRAPSRSQRRFIAISLACLSVRPHDSTRRSRMVNPAEALRLAMSSLVAHKLRSLLTLLGLIIAVSSLILVMTLVQGANVYVQEKLANLGTHVLEVSKLPQVPIRFEDFLRALKHRELTRRARARRQPQPAGHRKPGRKRGDGAHLDARPRRRALLYRRGRPPGCPRRAPRPQCGGTTFPRRRSARPAPAPPRRGVRHHRGRRRDARPPPPGPGPPRPPPPGG